MKRLARFLIRLYPANWRQRYGDEFEALLEDSPPGFAAAFDLLKGAAKMQLSVPSIPKLALLLSITGLLIGLAASFLVTPRYVSTAVMTYEGDLTGTTLREHVIACQDEVLSRTSLSWVIQDPRLELYKRERVAMPLEDVIEKMRRKDIRVTPPVSTGGHYMSVEISYTYRDPHKAQEVVQTLLTRFQEANLYRQQEASRRPDHLPSDPIGQLEARIALLEKQFGITPVPETPHPLPAPSAGVNLSVLDPPSLPEFPAFPNRVIFMSSGFASGFALALLIAIARKRPPLVPFPAV